MLIFEKKDYMERCEYRYKEMLESIIKHECVDFNNVFYNLILDSFIYYEK